MRGTRADTPYAALRGIRDTAAPFLTWYDDRTGARIELSMASLANAIAKAAGLLRDELDIEPGDCVHLDLPVHWQRAVWLGACWTVRAAAGIGVGPVPGARAAVTHRPDWITAQSPGGAPEVCEVSLAPLWLPARDQPDVFVPVTEQQPDDPAIALSDGGRLTASEVMHRARDLAAGWGLEPGGRLLAVDPLATSVWPGAEDATGWLACLAVPLAVGGSVVLVSAEDRRLRDRRFADEHATAYAGPP